MVELNQATGKLGRADAAANRRRILAAARQVFARRGLGAEMREIAEQAAVGIGTLYRHFESRDALLAAIKRQGKEEILERLQAVVEAEEPAAAFRAMMRVGAEVCEQWGALTEAVLSGRLRDGEDGEAEITQLLADLLRRGMATGAFGPDLDVAVAVVALRSVFTSGGFLELAAQRSFPGAAEALGDLFLNALTEKRKPPST